MGLFCCGLQRFFSQSIVLSDALLNSHICSGVYPYLQMAQLSHGEFFGETKKTVE